MTSQQQCTKFLQIFSWLLRGGRAEYLNPKIALPLVNHARRCHGPCSCETWLLENFRMDALEFRRYLRWSWARKEARMQQDGRFVPDSPLKLVVRQPKKLRDFSGAYEQHLEYCEKKWAAEFDAAYPGEFNICRSCGSPRSRSSIETIKAVFGSDPLKCFSCLQKEDDAQQDPRVLAAWPLQPQIMPRKNKGEETQP